MKLPRYWWTNQTWLILKSYTTPKKKPYSSWIWGKSWSSDSMLLIFSMADYAQGVMCCGQREGWNNGKWFKEWNHKLTIIELNQHLSDLSDDFCLKEAFVLNRKLFQMIMIFCPPPDLASSIAYTCSTSTVNQQIWSFKGNHVHRAPDLDIFK